jgi:NADH-quinone oxidoreductase subunit I
MQHVNVGLVRGLVTTARVLSRPTHTTEYPDVAPPLPPRTRGVIALVQENCTACMLCSRECPDWCIYIDSHKETVPAATPGGRERQRNVLDRFAIDFSLCMYCGICIEACPFDALHWSPEFEYAETDVRNLLHEKERLSQWGATVPPPPEPDPGAPESKEVGAARKAADRARQAAEKARQAAVAAKPAAETEQPPAKQPPPEPAAEQPSPKPAAEQPPAKPGTEPAAAGPGTEQTPAAGPGTVEDGDA